MSDKPEKIWALPNRMWMVEKFSPKLGLGDMGETEYIRADLAKPSECDAVDKCLKQAESMIGSPTEDDLQKFIDWMRDEFTPPTRETP